MQAAPLLSAGQRVLILYGDVPLITSETLQAQLNAAGRDGVSLLTVKASDPSGYGRVLRYANGRVRAIVEDKEATAKQRRVTECNTRRAHAARRAPAEMAQAIEQPQLAGRILSDRYHRACRPRSNRCASGDATLEQEVLGVNDRIQLAAAESTWRARQARQLMLDGATLVDPARVDVRGRVTVGQDVTIDVNVVFEGDVRPR